MTHAQLEREHVHTVKWHYYSVSPLNSSERKSPLLQKVEVASVLLLLIIRSRQKWLARTRNVENAASII